MDFTREPIIETVITPKEGCKLVVRSSKSTGQEEYFVDAVEVVSFGNSFFFRSLERPKSFLVPVSDYEILEVREARMVLKNVGLDRSIKIAGGRESGSSRPAREPVPEKAEAAPVEDLSGAAAEAGAESRAEPRQDKKRDRRRHSRRRRGRDEPAAKEEGEGSDESNEEGEKSESKISLATPTSYEGEPGKPVDANVSPSSIISSLLPPPTTLISETIARYKDNELFKGAFFLREEGLKHEGADDSVEGTPPTIPLEQPEFGTFEVSDDDAEEIYRLRASQAHEIPGAHTLSNEKSDEEDQPEDKDKSEDEETQPEHSEESSEASDANSKDPAANGNP